MRRRDACLLLATPTAWAASPVAPAQVPAFGPIKGGQATPAGWLHQTFSSSPAHNQFEVKAEDGRHVLRIQSHVSASGWVAALDADPAQTPWLQWQWKVAQALAQSDMNHKETDDYAARLYVFFAIDESTLPLGDRLRLQAARALSGAQVPAAALCYVWGHAQAVGTSAWNPYTNRLRMVTIDSGNAHAQEWRAHRRNLAADYQAAFGGPVPHISGVAVSADTDNTKGHAEAWFADIRLSAQ